MIIDVTNTIGRHPFKPEITAQSLLEQMDAAKIDIAVIRCHAEWLDNESVQKAFVAHPKRFIGLYTVNPWSPGAVTMLEEALANQGFKGLYLNPLRHGFMLSEREIYYPLLEVCQAYGAVVWMLGLGEVFSSPVFFNMIASDFRDLKIIMGRMGLQYDNASAVAIAREYPNIYLETSAGMDFNAHRAMKTAGIDKVMLGTGTPECNYYELELVKVRNAASEFPDGVDKVLYKNAAKLFGIEESVQ